MRRNDSPGLSQTNIRAPLPNEFDCSPTRLMRLWNMQKALLVCATES